MGLCVILRENFWKMKVSRWPTRVPLWDTCLLSRDQMKKLRKLFFLPFVSYGSVPVRKCVWRWCDKKPPWLRPLGPLWKISLLPFDLFFLKLYQLLINYFLNRICNLFQMHLANTLFFFSWNMLEKDIKRGKSFKLCIYYYYYVSILSFIINILPKWRFTSIHFDDIT